MTILQQNAPKTYGNAWLNPLHNRALSDATLARAGIRPDGRGWSYPIGPDSKARRWKAYPNQDGPKYLWKPEQPESARFYDPAGDLDQHVVAAGGVLLLAAGEPDTWSLWEAGLFHASCTLAGEGVIPPWFVGELHRLNVRTVRIWPDRDPAGLRHAVKLAVALAGSGIALEAYELPFDQASKGDINTLLIDVGAAGLPGALNACPAIDLVTLAAAADHQAEQLPQQRHSAPPADFASLFDQYRADLDQAVPSGWKKGKRNAKGFYQNIPCPFHEERNPSAGYNPDSSTVFCFVCGDHDYREIAAHVGFQAWDAYKADQLPRYSLADLRPVRKAEINSDYPTQSDTARAWRWTDAGRSLLLDLRRKYHTVPDLAPVVMLIDYLTEAGVKPGDPLTVAAMLDYCAPHGVTRGTVRAALKSGVGSWAFGAFGEFANGKEKETPYSQTNQNSNAGRRAAVFTLIDQDQALDRLCDLLRENALRAAAFQPEGVNQHTPDFLRCDAPYSLTPVELEAAESRRAPLYARQVAEIERAERHADREARRLRAALAVAFAPDNDLVTPFPPEVQTPNRTAYRDALLDLRREAKTGFSGEMIEPVSLACDASGYNVSSLYRSRARRGLVTDKRYTERRLQADRPVLDQLPDYLTRRGYGLRLQASGGDTFEITHKTRGFADHWAERQRAAGHTVIAWEQIASLERPATPDERRALEAKEAARRERARDRARRERARAGQETRLDQLPELYALRNAALGLQEFTGYRMEGDALIDADTGQTVENAPPLTTWLQRGPGRWW